MERVRARRERAREAVAGAFQGRAPLVRVLDRERAGDVGLRARVDGTSTSTTAAIEPADAASGTWRAHKAPASPSANGRHARYA
ncbi:MAG: hypothetical protein IPJ77_00580 [Planctomycetes bacterium]|nr:hypothetical protein [Planctomycetota bacterium]